MHLNLSNEKINQIITKYLEVSENVGEHAGGSGHLSDKSVKITKIFEAFLNAPNTWEISFQYVVFVITEFTYYPDNPPHETHYKSSIIIDDLGQIIYTFPKEMIEPVPGISMFPDFKLPDDLNI